LWQSIDVSIALKTFRLQLRFLVPLALIVTATAYLSVPLMDRLTLRWFAHDLDTRGSLVANALSESVSEALQEKKGRKLQALFDRAVQDERLVAIGWCSLDGMLMRGTKLFPQGLTCEHAVQVAGARDPEMRLESGSVHVSVHPITAEAGPVGSLVLLHDLSFVERRSKDTRQYLIALIGGLGAVIALMTVIVAQLSWRGWVSGARALLRGEGLVRPLAPASPELAPIAAELRQRLRDLQDEYRRSQGQELEWNAPRLQAFLRTQLRGDQVIVVSNREPYIHEQQDGKLVVQRPASGLVTAVEPVMRACAGTWIAHGSGSGDRAAVDRYDRVQLPPGQADYLLRRVWLTEEQEQGYYYGFANEGLWPLCHVAHVRPVFRATDWARYVEVNQLFADVVVAEARSEDPVVLVQDYHFALLPAMLRAKLPRATILMFWHIPWPNPESFGICPWREEILKGMLGSTILGFHTRFHCKNFIETVERHLEARIEHEHSTVTFGGAPTLVESYPISIEWPSAEKVASWPSPSQARSEICTRLGIPQGHQLVVGIDRFDYTKGILERLNAIERLLEKYPACKERFTFVQVAAPTRGALDEYRSLRQRIEETTARINRRFARTDGPVIRLLATHHDHDEVIRLYRAADVCLVTSLHDGMNLVCKEFIAARDDERGVLVLSRFAGAARELPEALIVNPYHVEEVADAIRVALDMPAAEQRERMANLRSAVRENNVYRWAGRMLTDAARLRLRQRVSDRVRRHQSGDDLFGDGEHSSSRSARGSTRAR
jgi:trehalose 6-phosphate synthase